MERDANGGEHVSDRSCVLAVLTAVGGLIWGFLQQPQRLDRLGFLSMLLPAGWAFGHSCAIGAIASP